MTKSLEDYLECIYTTKESKGFVQVKDIAKTLKVRMPSVNNAIAMLKKMDYVVHEPYGHIILTATGEEEAQKILWRHNILKKMLIIIGVAPERAEVEGCAMEHILSADTVVKIQAYFKL